MKIGLLAPFEGIYRQQGYDALAAMRAAIAETPSEIAILPLAVDLSDPAQAARTAAKLLADPTVRAIVGPFSPALTVAVTAQIERAGIAWYLPDAPLADSPLSIAWRADLSQAIGRATQAQGQTRLVLAGDPVFLSAENPSLDLPVVLVESVAEIRPTDAVLWAGDVAAGAAFLAALRARYPAVPFWLWSGGENPVFYRRAVAALNAQSLTAALGPVYWVAWLDDGYEAWAATHLPNSPLAYRVFRATQSALDPDRQKSATWRVQIFQLQPDGSSQGL